MFRYRNEAEFSKAVVVLLRGAGWFVQRIETGTTGKGVPDIYAISPTRTPVWIELKRERSSLGGVMHSPVLIHWRSGQQGWMMQAQRMGQRCMTLACFDDFILRILHDKYYKGNQVIPIEHACYRRLRDMV